ncbi:hypothetical protein NMY22_g23 [Coprinellus aureogranulatus]|nr:hypothetical protein NMY22_g23 [Coprinellus aureogranulatus]
MALDNTPLPSVQRLRDITQAHWGKRACIWQIKSGIANYRGKDVVVCSRTGSGKTLGFLGLFRAKNPRTVEELEKANIPSIALSKETIDDKVMQDIEKGKYNVIVISPELLMGDARFMKLWGKSSFTSKILNFIFDEAHCISKWGKFRNEYLKVGSLRYLIPERIPFYVTSATLPAAVLHDVVSLLQLRRNETEYIMRSNERPEIAIMVNHLQYSVGSFQDLGFLVSESKNWKDNDPLPKKFIVFFDDIKDTEKAAEFLQRQLPDQLKGKIRYFHATMTQKYRQETLELLRKGEIWGICATDAFGMGMDLPDIEIVVQWRSTCDMCTLWQRFGRAVRGIKKIGIAIFLVDKKEFEAERQARAERAEKRKQSKLAREAKKRKNTEEGSPSKRLALAPKESSLNRQPGPSNASRTPIPVPVDVQHAPADPEDDEFGDDLSDNEDSKNRGVAVVVGGSIDHLIDPGNGGYSDCRRPSSQEYFGVKRAQASDHLLCDQTSPDGCSFCRPQAVSICCDLCHPSVFTPYRVPPPTTTRGPNKTRAPDYDMSPTDIAFRKALVNWRHEAALAELGPFLLHDFGPKFILPDDTLDHIVNCYHRGTVTTPDELSRETDGLADDYSVAILSLIKEHTPAPPADESNAKGEQGKGVKKGSKKGKGKENGRATGPGTQRCGRCGGLGHNRSNKDCPLAPKPSYPDTPKVVQLAGPAASCSVPGMQTGTVGTSTSTQMPLRDAYSDNSITPATHSRPQNPSVTPSATAYQLPDRYKYLLTPDFLNHHR